MGTEHSHRESNDRTRDLQPSHESRIQYVRCNRADLDWKNGNFNWRYRNKLEVDRTIAVRSDHFIPYVAVEPYYESQYNKWSTTALYAGSIFPVGKHVEFNLYYGHENNTGGNKNNPENAIGLALYLFFSREKK